MLAAGGSGVLSVNIIGTCYLLSVQISKFRFEATLGVILCLVWSNKEGNAGVNSAGGLDLGIFDGVGVVLCPDRATEPGRQGRPA